MIIKKSIFQGVILLRITPFFLYYVNISNKYKVFNVFVYYLILSSGIYVVNFPLMDELILIISSLTLISFSNGIE